MSPDQLSTIPFYLDWKFWSFAVAFLALILSQLPPLHILFRPAKLDLEVFSSIHLTHWLGNPNAQLHLILSNTGGRTIRIKGITLTFTRDKDDPFTIIAQNYLGSPPDKGTILFTSFKLKPGDEWAHIVNFLNLFSRQEQKHYKQLEADLRQDIMDKRVVLTDASSAVAADSKYVEPIQALFRQKFRWHPGEYTLDVTVIAEPKSLNCRKRFRATIFESDSKELGDYSNDYKYGFGVIASITAADRFPGIILPISEA